MSLRVDAFASLAVRDTSSPRAGSSRSSPLGGFARLARVLSGPETQPGRPERGRRPLDRQAGHSRRHHKHRRHVYREAAPPTVVRARVICRRRDLQSRREQGPCPADLFAHEGTPGLEPRDARRCARTDATPPLWSRSARPVGLLRPSPPGLRRYAMRHPALCRVPCPAEPLLLHHQSCHARQKSHLRLVQHLSDTLQDLEPTAIEESPRPRFGPRSRRRLASLAHPRDLLRREHVLLHTASEQRLDELVPLRGEVDWR